MPGEENRVHSRVHLLTRIEIASAAGRSDATLRDLSKGGARFTTKQRPGETGDIIELFIAGMTGRKIQVVSEIVRTTEDRDGFTVAVRFTDVESEMRQELIALVDELLSTSGGGARRHPRIARRLQIRFGNLLSLKAILKNISEGGLAMTVEDPLVLHEEIEVAVPDTVGNQLLLLRAQVVHLHPIADAAGTIRYDVGLEFLPLRPEAQLCLGGLLKYLMETEGTV